MADFESISSLNVLLLDENRLSRQRVHELFFALGIPEKQLVQASALGQAPEENVFDLVFAEYPGDRNDFEALLKYKNSHADCILVLSTSHQDEVSMYRAAKNQVDGLLLRPFPPEALAQVLGVALGRRRQLKVSA